MSKCESKLIFCEEEDVEEVTDLLPDGLHLMHNIAEDEIGLVRSLKHICVVITDEELMRGIDYRFSTEVPQSETDGIDLLVARSFSSHRAYDQGRARVGRYREPCKRFILSCVEPVD